MKIRLEFAILSIIIGVILLDTTLFAPMGWFRQASAPDDPAYMDQHVDVAFGDAFTLLGYTLDDTSVAPGDWLEITLYWRAHATLEGSRYRPLLQIVNQRQTEAWAVNEAPYIGRNPYLIHHPDVFTSDVHKMRVFETSPPYTGWLTVQLIDTITGRAVPLADGADTLRLAQVRIADEGPSVPARLDYIIGDAIALRCVSTTQTTGRITVDLFWHVLQPLNVADVRVMMHGLAADGAMVANSDGPPLNNDYPTANWQAGQTLHDRFTLPMNRNVEAVRVGLYTPDGGRLSVTHNGNPVQDNAIVVPVEPYPCRR